jgi:hypothetical protein
VELGSAPANAANLRIQLNFRLLKFAECGWSVHFSTGQLRDSLHKQQASGESRFTTLRRIFKKKEPKNQEFSSTTVASI